MGPGGKVVGQLGEGVEDELSYLQEVESVSKEGGGRPWCSDSVHGLRGI